MLLRAAVISTAIGLILSVFVLFALGHRLLKRSWFFSLSIMAAITTMACAILRLVAGSTVPLVGAFCFSMLVAIFVILAFKSWNPAGHAAFTFVLLSIGTFIVYAFQVFASLRVESWVWACALFLLAVQTATLILLVAHTFEIIDVVCRTQWTGLGEPVRIPGYAPKVSLHVPIRNEPPDLVARTLNALARLEYPNYEVLVIDNNTEDEQLWKPVQAQCASLGSRFRFFHLLPWPGYKSGALNFALSQTASDAEIVGVVDADYVVQPNYLAETVGHFADARVAFVQTPQDYRDADCRGRFGRALYLAYSYFFEISMRVRSQYNAIIFSGTMGLIRRTALDQVGGWNEWCITEDAELSVRLLDAGYRSVYIHKTYGHGLMPLDYAGLKRQRHRWAFGGMQLLRLHAGRLCNPFSKGKLSFAQRFAYLSGGLQWLNDPATLAFTLLLLGGSVALVFGRSFHIQPLGNVLFLMPALFIFFAMARFLWAYRVRTRCTLREALDATTILLGLTFVVSLACLRGLMSRKGIFLRTPKQAARPTLLDVLRVVRWEFALSAASLVALLAIVLCHPDYSAWETWTVLFLLLWQAVVYASAVRSGLWSHWQESQVPVSGGTTQVGSSLISHDWSQDRWRLVKLFSLMGLIVTLGVLILPVPFHARYLAWPAAAGSDAGFRPSPSRGKPILTSARETHSSVDENVHFVRPRSLPEDKHLGHALPIDQRMEGKP